MSAHEVTRVKFRANEGTVGLDLDAEEEEDEDEDLPVGGLDDEEEDEVLFVI